MLVLCLAGQAGRDEHVVELLSVHIEQVCVALQFVDAGNGIHVFEPGDLHVLLEWLDEGEFVEVAGGDDVGVFVFAEDFLGLMLAAALVFWISSLRHHAPIV
jgi:hypothetical protein